MREIDRFAPPDYQGYYVITATQRTPNMANYAERFETVLRAAGFQARVVGVTLTDVEPELSALERKLGIESPTSTDWPAFADRYLHGPDFTLDDA